MGSVQDLERLEPVLCCLSPSSSGILYISSFRLFWSPQTCSACALHFAQPFLALPLFALCSTKSPLCSSASRERGRERKVSLCSSSLSISHQRSTCLRRCAHNTRCRHSGCNGTASLACHEPLLPMLLRSSCNRLAQQDLVTCCAAGRAPVTVGHSRISCRNCDSKNNVSSKQGLLSRRRQKQVAKLVFVRSASTDLVFILDIYALR